MTPQPLAASPRPLTFLPRLRKTPVSQPNPSTKNPTMAIVGGGLAGLSAAVAAGDAGFDVELFEQARSLGGRAGGWLDPQTGRWIDRSPHVAMGCCTSFLDFCRRTETLGCWRRHRRVHFIAPDGRQIDFGPSRWLPAPLHLLPGLLRLSFLTWRDRLAVIHGVRKLARDPAAAGNRTQSGMSPWPVKRRHGPGAHATELPEVAAEHSKVQQEESIAAWLARHGQSDAAVERFWEPVLVSALSERLERTSVAAARHVIVEGFLASRAASDVYVAEEPLAEILDRRVGQWLARRGVKLHRRTGVAQIGGDARRATDLLLRDGTRRPFDHVVLAVPWNKIHGLLPDSMRTVIPALDAASQLRPAPITAVHLWFDRPITPLPHAALIGRLVQWLFQPNPRRTECHSVPQSKTDSQSVHNEPGRIENPCYKPAPAEQQSHYYQAVISASHPLIGRSRGSILQQVLADLRWAFPAAREAELLHCRVFTQPAAVFAPHPGHEALRPPQKTPIKNLTLAGDWTASGWPATMEGAVRSGYLAVEAAGAP